MFFAWKNARHVEKIHIVNGLKPKDVARAFAGEDVGPVITKENAGAKK
jgi:hypothetical protein